MLNNTTTVAKKMNSAALRHVRATTEAEAIARIAAGESSIAILGLIELATACGLELDARGDRLPPPPWVETNMEDGIRYSVTMRVF
jgi:hypothetical protein